jgi:predicted DNA-binding transcriptional regulator YafY
VRALAKVVQVMPGRLRRRVEALAAMTVPAAWDGGTRPALDPGVLTTVALACRDAERIRFGYVAASGAPSRRHVEPHRLVSLGRRWYLVGYDLDRQDWRSFRLDRLSEPAGSGARFRPRELPAEDAAAFVRAGISSAWAVHEVEAVVQAPADQVRKRIGRWVTVAAEGPSRCRIRMTTDQLEWPLMGLGMTGAEFTVVGPPELVEKAREWGGRFGRAAG